MAGLLIEFRCRFWRFVKWHVVIPFDLWVSDRQDVVSLDRRDIDRVSLESLSPSELADRDAVRASLARALDEYHGQ